MIKRCTLKKSTKVTIKQRSFNHFISLTFYHLKLKTSLFSISQLHNRSGFATHIVSDLLFPNLTF